VCTCFLGWLLSALGKRCCVIKLQCGHSVCVPAGASSSDCFSIQTLPNAQSKPPSAHHPLGAYRAAVHLTTLCCAGCALWYFASRISFGLPGAWQQSPAGPAAHTLPGFLSLSDSDASTAVCSALPGVTCDLQGRVVQLYAPCTSHTANFAALRGSCGCHHCHLQVLLPLHIELRVMPNLVRLLLSQPGIRHISNP
jgi:hypothetical protein